MKQRAWFGVLCVLASVAAAALQDRPVVQVSSRSAEMWVDVRTTNAVTVYAYYATSNAGTTVANWRAVTNRATSTDATLTAALTNLTPNTTYWTRWQESNTAGTAWSTAQSFTTLASTTGTPSLVRRPLYVDGSGRISGAQAGVYDFGTNRVTIGGVSYTNWPAGFDPLYFVQAGSRVTMNEWLPSMVIAQRFEAQLNNVADNGGWVSGLGYTFEDQSGIFAERSSGYAWKNPWYASTATLGLPTPIAHWKMNDDAESTDVVDSASTNTGTAVQNTSAMNIAGMTNGALSFNGSTDKIVVGNNQSMHFGAGEFAIAMWVQAGSTGAGDLFHIGSVGAPGEIRILYESAYPKITLKKAGGAIADEVVDDVTVGQAEWHHYVLTRNGNVFSFYIDGNEAWTKTSSDALLDEGTGPVMGHGDSYFDGALDDVRVYTNGLSSAQVSLLYAVTEETFITGAALPMFLTLTNYVSPFIASNATLRVVTGSAALTTNEVRGYVIDRDTGATNWLSGLTLDTVFGGSNYQYQAGITNRDLGVNPCAGVWASSNTSVTIKGIGAIYAP